MRTTLTPEIFEDQIGESDELKAEHEKYVDGFERLVA